MNSVPNIAFAKGSEFKRATWLREKGGRITGRCIDSVDGRSDCPARAGTCRDSRCQTLGIILGVSSAGGNAAEIAVYVMSAFALLGGLIALALPQETGHTAAS